MFEIAAAIALVLLFYLFLLWALNQFFPTGTGLGDLMRPDTTQTPSQRAMGSLRVASLKGESALTAPASLVAVLSEIRNDVKSKRANEIAWETARTGMSLYDSDAVQTLNRSGAIIAFDNDSQLELGSNSLIIIKRMENDLLRREQRTFMVMMDGELRGRVPRAADKPVRVEIATPGGIARIAPDESAMEDVTFKIKVNSNASSTITVYQGTAVVTADGESVRIEQNQSLTMETGRAPAAPETLPEPLTPLSPRDNDIHFYRDIPPRIPFTWKEQAGASAYHFVLARDPDFRDVIHEDTVVRPSFTHGNLKEGEYHWRVSAIAPNQGEGPYSESRRLRLVRDMRPPALDVRFPPAATDQRQYVLQGTAEPGSRIFIDGQLTEVSAHGQFSRTLEFHSGINVVVVEAVDVAGNVTYRSGLVHGKF